MTTQRLLAVLLAGALITAPAALSAQLSTSLSIAGGLSAPVSDLGDVADAGYNVAGGLNFGAPLIPVGVRLEVGYNSFNGKGTLLPTSGSVNVLSGTANAVLALGPTGASPYVIGGVGMYRRDGGGLSSKTTGGVNGGAGFRFPLGLLSTFVEARYHVMLGNSTDRTNWQFVPITFGVSF